jgi:hypothetical protein
MAVLNFPWSRTVYDLRLGTIRESRSGLADYLYRTDDRWAVLRPKPKVEFIPPTPYRRVIEQGHPTHQYIWFNIVTQHQQERYSNYRYRTIHDGPFRQGYTPVDNAVSWKQPPPEVIEGANNKALRHLKGNKASLGLAFAERRKTAKHINDSVKSLIRAIRAVKRGDLRSATRALRAQHRGKDTTPSVEFSKRWLELQYGWRPLIGDVSDTISALNERDAADPQRYTVAAIGKYGKSFEELVHRPTPAPLGGQLGITSTRKQSDFYFCKYRVDAYVKNDLIGALNEFGFIDAGAIAWELVPWSFVADWFLPVGKYLDLITATSGLAFRAGSVTLVHEFNRSIQYDHPIATGGYKIIESQFDVQPSDYRRFEMRREVIYDFPVPMISRSKDPLRGLRVMNAVALLRSQFN